MAAADLLSPLDFQKIPCPRCRLKLEYAQKLINDSPSVNRTDIVSVCDHCLLKTKTEVPCQKCANIVNKFLAARGEQEKYKNKYFKSWLTKTEHQINESISEVKPQTTIQRSYSEININLPTRDTSTTVIKCEVQELFHSELNLTDTKRKKVLKQSKNLVPGLEKTVNFTDLIEMFHTVSSDSVVKNSKAERDNFYEQNEYYDLKPRSSSGAAHIRSTILKNSKHQDETGQMMEEKEEYLKEHKISYEDKFSVESEKSFIFPQTQQKPDKNLKRYISSPELIQDIREKLRLKAEEEEKEKKELELKAQEKKMKKLAREETNLIKNDLLHKEALSTVKLMDAKSKIDKSGPLKPETENIGKYSKREDDQMIQQEVIEKHGTKDKEESLKELELHRRLSKDKAAEFDKEKLIKTKMDHHKEKKLETIQVKELPLSKIKDKLDKHKRTKDIKEKEILIPSDEVKVSELKKHKDNHKMDKHKRAEDIKEQETLIPANKDKVSKLNKHEDLKEKQPLISDVKQLALTKGKDTDKPKKGENLKENELPISDIKHLAKVKKMESENEKNASTVKQPERTDIIPELTRKRGKASKDDADLEKKAGKSEGIDIISKLTPKKEGASKDLAGGGKKSEQLEGIDIISALTRKREKVSKDVAVLEKKGGDVPSKEIHKLSKVKPDKVEELKEVKGHEKKRDSLHPTEIGKSEKANNLENSKQNDVKLNQVKLLKSSADDLVTQLIKVNNKVLAKDSIKNKLTELPKVEELKEVKGHEKKRDTLHLTEIDKSEKANNFEDSKQNVVKFNQVKLIKSSAGDLVTQLIKVNNKVPAKDSIKTKLPELPKVEELKEAKGLEKKRDALQPIDIGKSEKANNLENSKQNDVKLNQVKLIKPSADDLITQLVKVNNKALEKDPIKPKLPELSKLLLETTKTKEKFAEKLISTPKPKPKDDTVDLPSKGKQEKQEKELKMSQVKLVESSFDNLILRLIKIRPAAGERSVNVQKIEAVKIKKRHRFGGTTTAAEEDQESAEEFSLREEPKSLGREGEQAPICPPQREGQEIKPIYVQLELSEISSLAPLQAVEEAQLETEDGKKAQLEMSKKKAVEPIDPEAGKGVIRYALSDRTFIEKGWTMLPVEKVVRKMNIYRMRPAQPEFDWFEHNKKKGLMVYDTGAKLAEFDDNGRGRWFYKNGCLALDYYEAEETNTQQRFVVYSNGEVDERGRSHPITILATFDHLGNGVVFDHAGKIRLKYNQTEGVLLDRSVGPVTNWKWHSLNDPPVLQQVMIDTQMPLKDPNILKMGGPADNRTRPDNEEMLAIEFDNFIKEKSKKLTQKFKPFQIKMKALKINDHFSLKVLDQATIYLIFRDGSANLKLNIGMVLDHKEIVDTDTAELGEVSNSMERFPARTDSLAALQRSVAYARRYERMRTERECKLRRPESSLSADNLGKAASRPLRPPLRTLPTFPTGVTSPFEASSAYCKCSRKPSSSLYYNTQLL